MNIFDCIFNRRSTRSFKPDEVDDKLIGVMLHAAIHAPSAGNTQEWQFIVVKDKETREKIANAALNQTFVAEAPVLIVVCIDKEKIKLRYGERGETLYGVQDTANAITLMMMAAEALGLNTCWIGAFDEEKIDYILDIPTQVRPVSIISVGYSDEVPLKPRRIPFEQLTYVDRYGKKYNIAYAVKPGDKGKEYKFTQIGDYLEGLFKKSMKEGRKVAKERISFSELLKRLKK
jgi:nitroreductase